MKTEEENRDRVKGKIAQSGDELDIREGRGRWRGQGRINTDDF